MKRLLLMLILSFLLQGASKRTITCDCDRVWMIRVNMHQLQIMIETYISDYGRPPINTIVLKRAAVKGKYWQDIQNPLSDERGYNKAYQDMFGWTVDEKTQDLKELENGYLFGLRVVKRNENVILPKPGVVLYEYVSNEIYYIYGTRAQSRLITDRGRSVYLTNG